jgi:iron complex outermembrane receptor protein
VRDRDAIDSDAFRRRVTGMVSASNEVVCGPSRGVLDPCARENAHALSNDLADRTLQGEETVVSSGTSTLLTAVFLVLFAGRILAQGPPAVVPGDLKKLTLDELQQIEVTSVSKRPEKLATTASAIQVITSEDIQRAGVTSVPEALRLAANLQVAQVDSRSWAISARGFNSTSANKLLVLIDGRAVYTPLYSGVFWDVQDTLLEDLDRIEVISGPGATLWGANAVNGVINIITKSAKDTQGLLISGSGGSEMRGRGDMRYGGTAGAALQYRAYGKFFDRDSSALPSGDRATNAWNMGQGGFRVDWDGSYGDSITVQGDVYNGRIAQLGTAHIAVNGGNLLGRWSHTFSKDSDLTLQMYYDRTDRNIPASFAEVLDTYDADFQHRFHAGDRHDIVWGVGYRASDDNVKNSAVLAFLPPHVSRQWFSGFAQDEVSLWRDRLLLTLGMKIEHNAYTGIELQPTGRLGWMLNQQQMLWGAVSRAVRTPSRIDREFFAPGNAPFLLAGGPDFVSETAMAYELGYRRQFRERLSLSVATFYNDYDRIRSLEQLHAPAPFPVVIANGLAGSAYGAELAADYRVADWWRIQSGYTGLHISLQPKPRSTDTTFGSSESHSPDHQIFVRQSWDLPRRMQADVGFRYVGRIANQLIPAYGEADARLAWFTTPTLECSIVGQNLLHRRHAEFGALVNRKEVERGIYARLAWRLKKS